MEIKDVVLDGEGVDLTINAPGSLGGRRNVRVDAQVKCTSDTSIFSGGVIKYSLPVKNYNTLRDTNSYCLQYLFLTCVPEHVSDYVQAYSDRIVLRNCTYWKSLWDEPETTNSTSVTVEIPMANVLTPEVLKALLYDAATHERSYI